MLSSLSSGVRYSRSSRPPQLCPLSSAQSKQRCVLARSRKRSPVTEGLQLVLKDELKIEKERYRTPDAVLEGAPNQFELEDKPNSNVLVLSRSFGNEEIFVEVDLDSQNDEGDEGLVDGDEEEDEATSLPPVTFTVSIIKQGAVLGFSCETAAEDITITHVSLNDVGEMDEDSSMPYTGPLFTELDDTLQQAFTDYLEERGINADFGAYLIELVHDKLEVEYMNWLTRVQDFVAS